MMTIYTPYRPPVIKSVTVPGESITVQGLVTSLSVILNGGDDNNMKTLDLGYSEQVRDLYPEAFGRPTRYELEYEQQAAQAYAEEIGVADTPPEPSSPSSPESSTSETETAK